MPIRPNPDVVCSPLEDGGVLLDLGTKQYYALNRAGLIAWQWLEDGATLEDLATALRSREQRDVSDDVRRFEVSLLDLGLAEKTDVAAGGPPPALGQVSWTTPTVTPHGTPLASVILSPFDPTVPIPE